MTPNPTPPLSKAATSLAVTALVASNFLMWGGFFLVIPLISVHFVRDLGWAATAVGLILGVRQLVQQGLTVFGGALADRVGARGLILAGLVIRAAGFAAMGWAQDFTSLMGAAVLAGLGGSLFDAPKNAAVATLVPPESRPRVFALMGVFGNLGMVVGPLVGAFLSRFDFQAVAVTAGSTYLVALVLVAATLPRVRAAAAPEAGLRGLGVAARDARFVRFTVFASGFFLLSSQLNVALTLRATALGGDAAVSWLYGVSAGLAVALQYPLLRLAERFFSARHVLVLGVVLCAAGLGLVALASSFAALLACVALVSLGSMLAGPTQQALVARLARKNLYGAYFGFGAISLGVGGALGNTLGGVLYDAGERLNFAALPWLTLLLVGIFSAAGLWRALADLPESPDPEAA